VQRPMEHICSHRSRNQRQPNKNNRSREYEQHCAFVIKMVDPNMDPLGDDDQSVLFSREPVQTRGTDRKYFSTEMEEELYNEN
jgi:hypothetical protein